MTQVKSCGIFDRWDVSPATKFNFGADVDHNPDPGIFKQTLPLWDRDNCTNFASITWTT